MNKKCQVFTPAGYVKELLDGVGYTNDLYGRLILENSCGDGNIMLAIVERYIEDARTQGISDEDICIGLARDIYGVEIDPVQYRKCCRNLNKLVESKGLHKIEWNIVNGDYLKWECDIEFQYIVGNPPYITYQELEIQDRTYLREHFIACRKGKFDYCYAFIEKSVNGLANDGKMAYLIPGSIFKTVFGENLRAYIKPYLTEIYDYAQDKLFDDALVKSAIVILDKGRTGSNVNYHNVASGEQIQISRANLIGKWSFTRSNTPGTRRFGDYFEVAHVVATLLNDAFVLKKGEYQESGDYYISRDGKIEKAIVRETATPRSKRNKKDEKIIFPYEYADGKLRHYTEQQFSELFPQTEQYLSSFRNQLDNRKKDKGALWFEYGRSQALNGLNRRKLLISTVITDKVRTYVLNKKCIPYAGMYIVPKKANKTYTIEEAKKILESDAFLKYAQCVGINLNGTSVRITSKDIENFTF